MTLTQQDSAVQQTNETSEMEMDTETCSLPTSPVSNDERTLRRSSTISESDKDKSTEKNDKGMMARRLSAASTATLTKVSGKEEEVQVRSKSDPVIFTIFPHIIHKFANLILIHALLALTFGTHSHRILTFINVQHNYFYSFKK